MIPSTLFLTESRCRELARAQNPYLKSAFSTTLPGPTLRRVPLSSPRKPPQHTLPPSLHLSRSVALLTQAPYLPGTQAPVTSLQSETNRNRIQRQEVESPYTTAALNHVLAMKGIPVSYCPALMTSLHRHHLKSLSPGTRSSRPLNSQPLFRP